MAYVTFLWFTHDYAEFGAAETFAQWAARLLGLSPEILGGAVGGAAVFALVPTPAGTPPQTSATTVDGFTTSQAQDETLTALQWTDPSGKPASVWVRTDTTTGALALPSGQVVDGQMLFDPHALATLKAGTLTAMADPSQSASGINYNTPASAAPTLPGGSSPTQPSPLPVSPEGGGLTNVPVNLGVNLNDVVFGGAQGGVGTTADGASTVPVAAGVSGASGEGGLAGVGAGPGSPTAPAGSTAAPTTSLMATAGTDGGGMATTAAPPLPTSSPPLIPPQVQTPQESFPADPSASQPTIFSTPIAPALPHIEQGPAADRVQGPQIVTMSASDAVKLRLAGYTDTNLPIKLGYITEGEINARGKAVGFHDRPGGIDPADARMTQQVKAPDANGIYTGKVEIRDPSASSWVAKRANSSFFPDNLSQQQIVEGTLHAFKESGLTGDGQFTGDSDLGFKIQGWYRGGKIETAYPLREP